ncbi:WGR domain-containing protein [Sinorhizobium garamanticum]|uniref:WGR domain-containing protein n=1 Tax=Sinorhizobium garamanticum TaxID=680247 RepID=UPI0031450599
MVSQPYHLYVERSYASKNMARFYALEISSTLFGETCLTRRWGRIGSRGQSKAHHFAMERTQSSSSSSSRGKKDNEDTGRGRFVECQTMPGITSRIECLQKKPAFILRSPAYSRN